MPISIGSFEIKNCTSISPDTGEGDPGQAEAPGELFHGEVVMVLLISLDPVVAIHKEEGHH